MLVSLLYPECSEGRDQIHKFMADSSSLSRCPINWRVNFHVSHCTWHPACTRLKLVGQHRRGRPPPAALATPRVSASSPITQDLPSPSLARGSPQSLIWQVEVRRRKSSGSHHHPSYAQGSPCTPYAKLHYSLSAHGPLAKPQSLLLLPVSSRQNPAKSPLQTASNSSGCSVLSPS